jgi:prepilin-type N-terminal cleavage/methylation domain-containing protein
LRGLRGTRPAEAGRAEAPRYHGFTLIEVLATLVLLGIVLPVAMKGVSTALSMSSQAKHMAEASALAQTKLNAFIIDPANNSATSGDFSPERPEYKWTIETQPRDYGLTEVLLHVTWQERGQPRQLTVSTLAYESGADLMNGAESSGTTTQ